MHFKNPNSSVGWPLPLIRFRILAATDELCGGEAEPREIASLQETYLSMW